MSSSKESKICQACGRPFTNRKKWSSRGIWDQVKYCSDACRKVGAKSEHPRV